MRILRQGLVTPLQAGLCVVRAAQAGNSVYASAAFVDRNFTVFYGLYLPYLQR